MARGRNCGDGRAARPGRQPRPVRRPGLAVTGVPHPGAGHLRRPAASGWYWRLLWFALTHPLLDAVATLVVVTWLGLGWPGVVSLALAAVGGLGRAAGDPAGVVRAVRGGAGAGLVAVVVLPAPLEGRDDPGRARAGLPRPADAPGPGPGAPGRGGRPGAGRPGDRTGPRRLRRQIREPGARVRRTAVPGPRPRARRADAGAGPRGHPRRPDPRVADHQGGRPGGAARRPVRGRDRRGGCGWPLRMC